MAVSENKRKNNDNYNKKCDYISIRPLKERGEQIRQAAKLAGQSLQGYILQACAERMERDGLPIDQPAADEENVVLVHIERLTDRALVHIDADAAALQTALHRDNVAPVTVQIENVGVKMADIQFHCSFPLIRRTP